ITSVLVLAGCFTLVHLFYEGIVRPTAAAILAAGGSSGVFSVWVILKDMEQQVCFSLLLFCLFLMGYKLWRLLDEETLYTRDFLRDYDKSLPLDVELALSELEASSYKDNPAMATWINCIRRFKNTRNVQHAADAIESSV